MHLGIDANTLEIRAIEVSDNSVGDAPMLPEWLGQIPLDDTVASVSGDGSDDTKACHAAIAQRGAQAVIPPRRNARPWKTTRKGSLARNEALKACHRLGRSIWKKWSGYHRRSLAATKTHGFKRLGDRVMARTFERQVVSRVVELHVRVALLNRFTQLGRPTTVPVAAMASLRLGLGASRLAFDLRNKAELRETCDRNGQKSLQPGRNAPRNRFTGASK